MSDASSASKAPASPGPSIAPLAKYKLVFLGDQGVGTPIPSRPSPPLRAPPHPH